MEEDIKVLKNFINIYKKTQEMYKDDEIQAEIERSCYFEEVPAKEIETILNELERLQKENEQLIADNLEYQRVQDIFDKRTYRKKYLEERRKEQPNLLYPDADEIYKRYYELKEENEKKSIEIICYQEELENSIPKQVIRGKINTLEMEEHYDYIDNKKAISVLKELLGE